MFQHASKAEIARFARLTPPAVATIVDALEEGGYVRDGGRRFGGKGQPSALYELSPSGAYSIGLHIGRRSLDAVLIDFCGRTQAFESHDHDHPDPAVVRRIANAILKRFRHQLGDDVTRLVGIGVSAPYFIGGWDSELGFPSEIGPVWKQIDLASDFLDTNGLPVQVENDASAAAIAELVQGLGVRYRIFCTSRSPRSSARASCSTARCRLGRTATPQRSARSRSPPRRWRRSPNRRARSTSSCIAPRSTRSSII